MRLPPVRSQAEDRGDQGHADRDGLEDRPEVELVFHRNLKLHFILSAI